LGRGSVASRFPGDAGAAVGSGGSAVSVRDCGEPLTEQGESFGPSRALVRASVVRRLVLARDELPRGVGLRVVAGYRTPVAQRAIISSYAAGLRMAHPVIGGQN